MRHGTLLKSPTALERLAEIDMVVFDKTGTLTEPTLALDPNADPAALAAAAALASASRHPLARAVAAAAGPVVPAAQVFEVPGEGMRAISAAGEIRLGSRNFCGGSGTSADGPELWLSRPQNAPVRFGFTERIREDAVETIARLRRAGLRVAMLSGDQPGPACAIAGSVGIRELRSGCSPIDKVEYIETMRNLGFRILMVGDGLNDAPSLAAAHVSVSPSTAADISQNVADVVFQGARLGAVADLVETARRARTVIRQNLAMALCYNAVMLPLAVAGYVTPWLAAAAMSTSSLAVMLNSLRLQRGSRA
jgi:P-type Cu2+ transporter